MRWVYFGQPHLGGTWSVFTSLRQALSPHGIDLRWLGLGPLPPEDARRFADALDCGEVVAGADDRSQARALHDALVGGNVDGVFVNVHAHPVQTNMARYLPPEINRILIVHTITPTTYRAARAVREHVHRVVAVAPRIRDDLVERHGFDPDTIAFIANSVDLSAFAATEPRNRTETLRVLCLGRIDDTSKGVFWLPAIMGAVRESVRLTVVGDGPDREVLAARCQRLGERIRIEGAVTHDRVAKLLREHDALLLPSRFEGMPNSLLEAMAAGCVPVASRIRGVTDNIVQDGENGCLFPIGDTRAAAQRLDGLASDRRLLDRLSRSAALIDGRIYSREAMGAAYAQQIRTVCERPRTLAPPQVLGDWRIPALLKPQWLSHLPQGVKNWMRRVLIR